MRFVVLDASVSIKWYLMEGDSDLAQKLLDSELLSLAPDLFFVEVAGALIRQHREYGQISRDDVRAATEDLLQLGIESVSSEIVLSRAVDISMALGHPIKDCLYLALAERWQTVLVTADLKLVGKANASVWANFVSSLSNIEEIIRNP